MCGGVREFESMRAPALQMVSLLHDQEIRQYEYADVHLESSVVGGCVEPAMKAHNIVKTRHELAVDAGTPAGLALVAAMGSKLGESAPATTPAHGPITKLHFSTNQEKQGVEQSQSRATARAAKRPSPAVGRAPSHASGRPGNQSLNVAVPISSGCRKLREGEKLSKRSSIFCSAFSPPKDCYLVDGPDMMSRAGRPSADFMGACFLCHRPLGSGIDIYMYRGDRAFCSNECRYQHIVEDDLSERGLQQQNSPTSTKAEPAHCKNRAAASRQPNAIPVLG